MRVRVMFPLAAAMTVMLFPWPAEARPGDVEGSHDYPGFTRVPGFVISDYDEDNPGDFNFPISHPLPVDADNVDQRHVEGHRYRIRYEAGPKARQLSLLETQQYYEKLAATAGFMVEKSGAIGDLSETFHRIKNGHSTWAYLEPSGTVNVLTVVEEYAAPPSSSSVVVGAAPSAPAAAATGSAPPPSPVDAAPSAPASPPPAPDDLETALSQIGRAALLLDFLPNKADLRGDAQPEIDRIATVMQDHPTWHLTIEGHTDSTGDPQDNQFLSAQRARTVRGMLIAEGITPTRLTAIGLGGSYPIADDTTAEGRAKNRRIELVVRKE